MVELMNLNPVPDTKTLKEIVGLWDRLGEMLGPNALAFFERVYTAGLGKYEERLRSIGFSKLGSVLDAGCGLGQWSFSLARLGNDVYGVDVAVDRVRACRYLAVATGCEHASFAVSQLERLPFSADSFDGVVCYSVLYLTDYSQAIRELARVTRIGGLVYLSTNGIGRYLYDLVNRPNPAADFDPRKYALRTLRNLLIGKRTGLSATAGGIAMGRKSTSEALEAAGFEIVALGAEGTLCGTHSPFVPGRYLGFDSAFDILARKR